MTWSYSRLEIFDDCPYRWFLTYIHPPKLKKEDRIDIIRDFLNSYDSNMYELFMNMDGYIDMDTKKLKKTDF